MKRLITSPFAVACWILLMPVSTHAVSNDGVEISIRPDATTLQLGESVDAQVEVTNTTTQPTDSLVVHIDITDPAHTRSVDPEDWTSKLTQRVGVIDPGDTVTVTWTLQPIAEGQYVVYAVALAPDATTLAASNVAHVDVTAQRSLNPGGILPVAIGAPTLVGGLLVFQIRRSRRTRPPHTAN